MLKNPRLVKAIVCRVEANSNNIFSLSEWDEEVLLTSDP